MYSEIDVMDGLIDFLIDNVVISRVNNDGVEQVIARNYDGRVFKFTVQEVAAD